MDIKITDIWNWLKGYHEDLIVLFCIGYAVKEVVIPVIQTLLGI